MCLRKDYLMNIMLDGEQNRILHYTKANRAKEINAAYPSFKIVTINQILLSNKKYSILKGHICFVYEWDFWRFIFLIKKIHPKNEQLAFHNIYLNDVTHKNDTNRPNTRIYGAFFHLLSYKLLY